MINTQNKVHDNQRCNHCGQSVAMGSGKFVNRINDFNDLATRRFYKRKYIWGDFICQECDEKSSNGYDNND
jgi:hypothetical protein